MQHPLAAAALALWVGACTTPAAPPPTVPAVQAPASLAVADLAGTWDVALYFDAEAPPSATEMVLAVGADGSLSGNFYGSAFIEAGAALRGDRLGFAATTADGSGTYFHSGRLLDGRIEGQTLSEGRDFVMVWQATRRTTE